MKKKIKLLKYNVQIEGGGVGGWWVGTVDVLRLCCFLLVEV